MAQLNFNIEDICGTLSENKKVCFLFIQLIELPKAYFITP